MEKTPSETAETAPETAPKKRKKYVPVKIHSTPKQMKAAIRIVENLHAEKPRSLRSVLTEVGYSESMADRPNQVLESQGFKRIFEQIGLTPAFVIAALKEDIDKKPQRRLGELNLAAEVLSMKKQDPQAAVPQLNIVVSDNTPIPYEQQAEQNGST